MNKLALLSIVASVFLLGCSPINPPSTYLDSSTKHLQVTSMKPPKRFKVEFVDASGATYSFRKKRCSIHADFAVGSWHYVRVDRYQEKTEDGTPRIRNVLVGVCG